MKKLFIIFILLFQFNLCYCSNTDTSKTKYTITEIDFANLIRYAAVSVNYNDLYKYTDSTIILKFGYLDNDTYR